MARAIRALVEGAPRAFSSAARGAGVAAAGGALAAAWCRRPAA